MMRKIGYRELRAALLRRIFRRPSSYTTVCERSWTISPAEVRMERPAVFLDGELEKVLGVQEETTMQAELVRVASGFRQHAETRAYLFKDVGLQSGRLLKGAMSHRLSQLSDDANAVDEVHMPSAVVGSTLMGSVYFGHWLHDDASLSVAVESIAPAIEIARQAYSHEAGYRRLLSLPENRVVRAHFGELVLLDDWGQNADKRRRYQELRSRFRRNLVARGSEQIYIRRGRAGAARGRDLINAAELEADLIARGFTVVDPDTMSAEQIAILSADAKLVVGMEGSHLAHAIYPIADSGTIVTIQPPLRFNNVFKDLTDAMGLQYAFVVGVPAQAGFTVELDRLNKLLDRVAVG